MKRFVDIALVPDHTKVWHLKPERIHGLMPEIVLNRSNEIAQKKSKSGELLFDGAIFL